MTQRIHSAQVVTAPDRPSTESIVPSALLMDESASPHVPVDLIIAVILTLAATASTLLEAPPILRIPLGLLLVLALPGFGIVSALFPSDDGPDAVARVALSVALSLATLPFIALTIDRSPWRLERVTVTIGLMTVALSALFIASGLRARLPIEDRYAPHVRLPHVPSPRDWTMQQIALGFMFFVAASLFAYGGFDVVKTRLFGEPTTEFALFNAEGEAQFYPRDIEVGEAAEVQVSIANHEGKRVRYELVISGAGRALDVLPDLSLKSGETWQGAIRFTVTSAGNDLPVRFELYRDDQPSATEPYRLLILIAHGLARTDTEP